MLGLTCTMSSLKDLRRTSQDTICPRPGSWAEPVSPDAPKPRLPPFREILPATHVDSSPPETAQGSGDLASSTLETYYLPFRRPSGEVVTMPFTMVKPDNEAIHSTTRKTVQGKTLTYTLNVKQQPERARACGAGARGESLSFRPRCDPVALTW